MMPNKELDQKAVENFREYLRIPSAQPDVNYDECVEFLTKQAKSLDLPIKIYHVHPKKPIVILTWKGNSDTDCILLNSHMDVVPVYKNKWTYPPFSAHMDDWGNIYGRGSQDTKCVGIQYLEAIRRLKADGYHCQRTIYISFVPGKEIDASFGLKQFVHTPDFSTMNVACALDASMPSTNDKFLQFIGEKSTWLVQINCASDDVNGSIIPNNTAGEKLRKIMDRFMEIDISEKQKYLELVALRIKSDEVTSLTLTKVWGGVDANDVLPSELNALFEIDLGSTVDHNLLADAIDRECKEVGVTYSFQQKIDQKEIKENVFEYENTGDYSRISKNYLRVFNLICSGFGLNIKMRPTSSDSRFLREMNIPVISFSPINNTRVRYHDHDEYINKLTFLKGIRIYTQIIFTLGNANISSLY